jgi:ribonuclease HI
MVPSRQSYTLAGWGCIRRDSTGDSLFAAAGQIGHASEPAQTEAHALIQAFSIAEQMGMGCVIFEIECLVLKQAITGEDFNHAPMGSPVPRSKTPCSFGFH